MTKTQSSDPQPSAEARATAGQKLIETWRNAWALVTRDWRRMARDIDELLAEREREALERAARKVESQGWLSTEQAAAAIRALGDHSVPRHEEQAETRNGRSVDRAKAESK